MEDNQKTKTELIKEIEDLKAENENFSEAIDTASKEINSLVGQLDDAIDLLNEIKKMANQYI